MTAPTKTAPAPSVGEGGKRCSKTCGFGCTQASYDRAVLEADALAAAQWPDYNTDRRAQFQRILRDELDYWIYWSV